MKNKKITQLIPSTNKDILVIGSSCIEETFSLPIGVGHEADATLTMHKLQQDFGGAGLCNAVAIAKTGYFENIKLFTVAGKNNNIPDQDAQAVIDYLTAHNIDAHVQLHDGPTERTLMILSSEKNDVKRGFRIGQSNGRLLRDEFIIDFALVEQLKNHEMVLASSFDPKQVVNIARAYKSMRKDKISTFIWTLNKDSATKIATDISIQESIREGLIDIAFLSRKELETIEKLGMTDFTRHIKMLLITEGKKGCSIVTSSKQGISTMHIPAFAQCESIVNDNGAGEAHHISFLVALLSCQEAATKYSTPMNFDNTLIIAANIANMAAYLKIQQPNSMWFPKVNLSMLKRLYSDNVSARNIAKDLYILHKREITNAPSIYYKIENDTYETKQYTYE